MIAISAPPQGDGLGDWLEGIRSEFFGLETVLLDLQHRAAIVAASELRAGHETQYLLAREAVENIGALRLAYGTTRDRFAALIDAIPGLGAIVVPAAYAAAAVAVAFAIYGIFRRSNAQEQIVELLEAGRLTPAEAEALLREADSPVVGGVIGGAGAGVLLAVALWAFLQRGRA